MVALQGISKAKTWDHSAFHRKLQVAFTEWEELRERCLHNGTSEEELRHFGKLTVQTAKKAIADIEAGRAAQKRAKRAEARGDLEKRRHFR